MNNVPTFKFHRLRLYPLVCIHVGAPQCDVKFLREHLRRIADDPDARWVYLGDGGECATKHSKGDIYGQLLSPQGQMEMLIDLLTPIKDKALFGVRGNHGRRVYKETGLSFDKNLMARLGVPYMGVGTFAHFLVNRTPYTAYFHHGTDSGTSLRAKISAAESFGGHIFADSIYTAHSHIAEDLTPSPIQFVGGSHSRGVYSVETRMRHQYVCGTAYDSRTGYAEDKGYKPLLPAYLAVEYDGRIIHGEAQRGQRCEKWRSSADYKLRHDYLDKYVHAIREND